jgi:uncharacterized protein
MHRPIHLLFAGSLLLSAQTPADWQNRPINDTSKSPHALLHGVPVSAVSLGEGFWSPRRKVNVEVSIPTLLQLFEENGVVDNFRRISGHKQVARRGPLYTDSDLYKWLEAVAFVLQGGDNPKLRAMAEGVIGEIVAAQQPDGYLNTYFSGEQRHTNMRGGHELYCLGHMLQAGIAWYRATGDTRLLDSGRKMVAYLLTNFGPNKKPIFEGHPEIEMALIELYRTTGNREYLDFAGYLLHGDPRNNASKDEIVYLFTIKPFTERTKLEGHAVRAMYASSGATDYYIETGDAQYWKTLGVLWDDMVRRKMYITGGVGSRSTGEAFGEPYELPNQVAYTESCAAIGNVLWNWRMLEGTGDAKYTDTLERALYNGANSGLSLSGSLYCYRNPLELVGNPDDKIRNPWYDTTCCPPNLQRILASLPGYFYSTSKDGVWVHLFHQGKLAWHLEDGSPIEVSQKTGYPWEGAVELTISPAAAKEFTVFLRVPAWAHGAKLSVNGKAEPAPQAGAYAALKRKWNPGDRVTLAMDVMPRLTSANPRVRENLGKVAVERGALVYCLEELDQPKGVSLFDWTLAGANAPSRSEWRADLLGGVTVVHHPARATAESAVLDPLYSTFAARPAGKDKPGDLTFIPYYTFANRGASAMEVWIPLQ